MGPGAPRRGQLVAGAEDRHSRPAPYPDLGHIGAGGGHQGLRSEARAAGEQAIARSKIRSALSDMDCRAEGRFGGDQLDVVAVAADLLLDHHPASSVGQRRPGKNADAFALRDGMAEPRPRKGLSNQPPRR